MSNTSEGCYYSDVYADDTFEYRHVGITKSMASKVPKYHLMREMTWRKLGVAMSRGWMNYAIHPPERDILLFKRPKDFLKKSKEFKEAYLQGAEAFISKYNRRVDEKLNASKNGRPPLCTLNNNA